MAVETESEREESSYDNPQGSCTGLEFKANLEKSLNFKKKLKSP